MIGKEDTDDLLEILYKWWKDGRPLTITELSRELSKPLSKHHLVIKNMIRCGYLEFGKEENTLELTPFGKTQGAECISRQKYLTQFIQMVSGLKEEEARENAARMRLAVSENVIKGIAGYLKYGDRYDRVISDTDLCGLFEEGIYEVCLGIYEMQQRYPRVLSEEFYEFVDVAYLNVSQKSSWIYLRKREQKWEGEVYYRYESEWHKAAVTTKGYQIPVEAFVFTVGADDPIIEGEGVIASMKDGQRPKEGDCRELNIHIW